MDSASISPDPRERAASSEPCSTRPNPFGEDERGSRKRQRTSLPDSRSPSTETIRSLQDSQSLVPPIPPAAVDAAMAVDDSPATPETPEASSPENHPQPTSVPTSSRVTINLRTPQQNPVSDSSPCPSPAMDNSSTSNLSSGGLVDDIKLSVEPCEVVAPPSQGQPQVRESKQSVSSDGASPDVEIIAVQEDDEDDAFASNDPEVSILGDETTIAMDPTSAFPYSDGQPDSYIDTLFRLTSYLSNQTPLDEGVFDSLRSWMESYLRWAVITPYPIIFDSFRLHRALWMGIPDIIWAMSTRKTATLKSGQGKSLIGAFYLTYAKLTAFFVTMDLETLNRLVNSRSEDDRGLPDTISHLYLNNLHNLTYRAENRLPSNNGHIVGPDSPTTWLRPDDISELINRFQLIRGGSLAALIRLAQYQIALIPKCPKIVERLYSPCSVVADIVRESYRKQRFPGMTRAALDHAKSSLVFGYRFYESTAATYSTVTEKYASHLSGENTMSLIGALTDILQYALLSDSEKAIDTLAAHRAANPNLPSYYTAEAVAFEWRFDELEKLVKSGQMQLRVFAVTTMCTDLVSFWKRFNLSGDPDLNPFLCHFADYLMRTELVEYLLGPTCHPEITIEGGNIVGFLLITKYYERRHADLMWQTITTCQNPRVADALLKMTSLILNLYDWENLLYFVGQLLQLPVEAFMSGALRILCDHLVKFLVEKWQNEGVTIHPLPFELFLKSLRLASVCTANSQIAYPEVYAFSGAKLDDMLQCGPEDDNRRTLHLNCLSDLGAKSSTTLGSLFGLWLSLRHSPKNELHVLVTEHGLTRLLVEELVNASQINQSYGFPMVLAGRAHGPRKELIQRILLDEPDSVSMDLGQTLWNYLVDRQAASEADRTKGWEILIHVTTQTGLENPVISTFFSTFFPKLPSDCLCEGALSFIKTIIGQKLEDPNKIVLDDDVSVEQSGIGQLWRIILSADDQSVATAAIQTLVRDIYIESSTILSYPHARARQVHVSLVNRCLDQMQTVARRLQSAHGKLDPDSGDPMVITPPDMEMEDEERMFNRSLAVLRQFLLTHQSKAHFSTPTLRSLTDSSMSDIDGELAELKYQSFDGDKQTDIQSLKIGRRNTAASLLASLREATGFENYRVFYRGRPFTPNESDICKSIEDLNIHTGLLLVKREDTGQSPARKVRLAASSMEVEILGHFNDLWSLLSMEEKFAHGVYQFLIKLPPDDGILASIEAESTSIRELFPLGQPFKSLYVIWALREYMQTAKGRRRNPPIGQMETEQQKDTDHVNAVTRVLTLLFGAISDADVVDQCPSSQQKFMLWTWLTRVTSDTLKVWRPYYLQGGLAKLPTTPPLDRLLSILLGVAELQDENPYQPTTSTYSIIVSLSTLDALFWEELKTNEAFGILTKTYLLHPQSDIREQVARGIRDFVNYANPDVLNEGAPMFWNYILEAIDDINKQPNQCREVLVLAEEFMLQMAAKESKPLDIARLGALCGDLLLQRASCEEMSNIGSSDPVLGGLVRLLSCALEADVSKSCQAALPMNLARDAFWAHLFPGHRETGNQVPKLIFNVSTRSRLYDIIFRLVSADSQLFKGLLDDLLQVVPFVRDVEDPYIYDLPPQFDRYKAIRSPCGYVGLRNLSNTCYLNSLCTQLFMNTDFRGFILSASVKDSMSSQRLLFQTQKVFAHMQESVRRFVDPQSLVSSIKTYDDTVIDIHNQMDVDEFYNLLFDRWESQLVTADEKNRLRSFYGGQLVQQVKSKECEHVSERLEPFSAIQCDIKGKKSLEESLQAYVDGEVMEGDNKYKCSMCDAHVDAVKRTCLKDIPNDLIFHLKRFDFNLRTMQRSKINDYFAFPRTIDLARYTADYLTAPQQPIDEDIFELVGILVHSGTAESGHYYSYIRERPTTQGNERSERWFEFNDDMVCHWDSSQMENSSFGGLDHRNQFDQSATPYEKPYSAYMLFYKRSTELRSRQEMVGNNVTIPLAVDIPQDLSEHIKEENHNTLMKHCLYDPAHLQFVGRILELALHQIPAGKCSEDHKMEGLAIKVGLGHFDQAVSRTLDLPDLRYFEELFLTAVKRCPRCALSLYHYFYSRPESFRTLVQRSPEPRVRTAMAGLFLSTLKRIKTGLPAYYGASEPNEDEDEDDDQVPSSKRQGQGHTVIEGTVMLLQALWNSFYASIRSWHEVFGLILGFARLGDEETVHLLANDWLLRLIRIVHADETLELTQNFVRMLTNIIRRMPARTPQYDSIISLIDYLMGYLDPVFDPEDVCDRPESRLEYFYRRALPLQWTSSEGLILHQDWGTRSSSGIFVEKLIQLNQAPDATESIISRLVDMSRDMDQRVYQTLRINIGSHPHSISIAPFLSAAVVYCRRSQNLDYIHKLIHIVAIQSRYISASEGRAYLEFQQRLYYVSQQMGGTMSPQSKEVLLHLLMILQKWAPSMLASLDPEVRNGTEEFLYQALFQYGECPTFVEEDGGAERQTMVVNSARHLGIECLVFIRDAYCLRRGPVSRDSVAALQRVIAKCSAYFNPEAEDEDGNGDGDEGGEEEEAKADDHEARGLDIEFAQLSQSVLESLHSITVDELEEEGDGISNHETCSSSSDIAIPEWA